MASACCQASDLIHETRLLQPGAAVNNYGVERESKKDRTSRTETMDTAFLRQIEGFSLTTAEILYRLPDHPKLIQSYIWQDYDVAPRFPKLTDFLDFWAANLDGALYRIRVAHRRLIAPAEFSFVRGELRLN
jgi:uncharacterized protein Usg